MTLHIGITGNMGSGKSLVCKLLNCMYSVPVFDADAEAKAVMVQDPELKAGIIQAFGTEAYLPNGEVNRAYLSAQVFGKPERLAVLNALVHPASLHRYAQWKEQQHSPYALKEAALLFEATDWQALDATIVVACPENTRLKRVLLRDPQRSEKEIRNIFARQWPEEEKLKLATHTLVNDGVRAVLPQVMALHTQFMMLAAAKR